MAHMAPDMLTFVCQIPLYTATIEPTYEHKTIVFVQENYTWPTWLPNGRHLWSKLPRMAPHIHTSFIGNVDLGYTRAIRSCISMHTCSQVSLHPGFQVSIHPFHQCFQSLLNLCHGGWVGWPDNHRMKH